MNTEAANHPPSCRACHGTGLTLQPCTHHWTNDEPHPEELITLNEYLRRHPEDTHLFNQRQTT